MMHVALTGGMGSGKTFVLSCFRDEGWITAECDAINRDLIDSNSVVASSLRDAFGEAVFDSSGAVDRKKLAAKVFGDTARLHQLEEIMHPMIRQEWMRILDEAGARPAIVEIPLLFEKKLEKLFKVSVCVTVSKPTQIARLAGRGFTEAEALARISKQMPLQEKELRAGYVILNNGNQDYTRAQVARLTHTLASRA